MTKQEYIDEAERLLALAMAPGKRDPFIILTGLAAAQVNATLAVAAGQPPTPWVNDGSLGLG